MPNGNIHVAIAQTTFLFNLGLAIMAIAGALLIFSFTTISNAANLYSSEIVAIGTIPQSILNIPTNGTIFGNVITNYVNSVYTNNVNYFKSIETLAGILLLLGGALSTIATWLLGRLRA